ncbi:MAG: transporter substrate-binding domain-containing protein [Chloroflexi bacterium]|nr:transporter substrate-binding domain-containing protein [Chloroflexota bacterium]
MIRLVLATVLLISFSLSCDREADVVRLGTEGAYPPYNFINDHGEIDGFERELGDELCRRADLECIWVTDEWNGMIPNLIANAYDAIITGMSITDERDQLIDFTQPYIPPSPSVYLARAGSSADVVNRKVAAQVATIQADYLSQSDATLSRYPLVPDAVSAVLDGEADAALVDLEFARESMAENEGRLTMVGPRVTLGSGVGIGVREQDGQLKDKLDHAIGDMKADGSLNDLIRKWFGADAETF